MAPWLVLLLPWSVLAFEPVDREDSVIMKAIMSQIVISLQRDYKQATEIRNTDKTRVKEVPSRGRPPLQLDPYHQEAAKNSKAGEEGQRHQKRPGKADEDYQEEGQHRFPKQEKRDKGADRERRTNRNFCMPDPE